MNEAVKNCLWHIGQAIDGVAAHLRNTQTFSEYLQNTTVQRAVEREIEIMGEAMTRILKEIPTINISDAKRIVYTRNRIIHGYDSIDQATLWLIIQVNLPVLKIEVEALLSQTDS